MSAQSDCRMSYSTYVLDTLLGILELRTQNTAFSDIESISHLYIPS